MLKKAKIKDLGTIITGRTPSTKNDLFWNGEIDFITPKDIQVTKHIFKTERSLSYDGMNAVASSLLPANAICVSCIGYIGYVGMTTKRSVTNQQINSIICNQDNDPNFVFYLMKSLWSRFKKFEGQSTTISILNKGQFSDIDISLPSLQEQKKIAAQLSCIDEKIELNAKINYNLQEQARALFKAWFVDYIPFGGSKPANWKAGKLKDILLLKRNAIKPGENTELNYLPIDAIPMNTFAVSEVRPNNEAQSSLITFNRDDIIIGAMRIYFHRVIIAPFDGITRTTCFTLCSRSKEYLAFNLLCCDQDSTIEYAQATSRGSTMPYAVWDGGLGEMMIEIPDKAIALEFNEIVLPIIRTIQSSFLENKRLQELRDGLLPRLITGELDVSGLEL